MQHRHLLPHQHQQQTYKIEYGHPSQRPIKNYIYNTKRENIKALMDTLKSINELSKITGDENVKKILFTMSQDNATSNNILQCANIYKNDRNAIEFNSRFKKKKSLRRTNSL